MKKGGHKGGKKGGKRGKGRKSNPSNPHGKHKGKRRRRNPGTFMQRLGSLLGGAAIALATGAVVTYATGKVMVGSPVSLYGIPAATLLGGVALAGKYPTIGTGLALGAFGPFAIPLGTKLLTAGTPSANASSTAAVSRAGAQLGEAMRGMGSVSMGATYDEDGMGAVMDGVEEYN